ncbi:MAG: M28 family metallopeptidase [Limnochordia bacterium]
MIHVSQMLTQVDEARMNSHLLYIARHPLPFRKVNYTIPGRSVPTLEETDRYIVTQLTGYGYCVGREPCLVKPFGRDLHKPKRHQYAPPPPDSPAYTVFNLYGHKTGQRIPDEIILLLAHKDSQSWIDSPGAYDNGVGTVALLELARLLATYPTKRTVRFLFCNEEHTPWTSITAARRARERNDHLISVINLDSLGGKSDEAIAEEKKTNVTLYTEPQGKRVADLIAEVNLYYAIGLEQESYQRPAPGDDDGSFVRAGYGCAVCNIGSYPYADRQYHLEGDTPDRVDIANVRMATQATLAAVLHIDKHGI